MACLPTNLLAGFMKYNFFLSFIGQQVYAFGTTTLLPGFPKPLSALGLPENLKKIDAALVWGHNNRTYFYSGKYRLYSPLFSYNFV